MSQLPSNLSPRLMAQSVGPIFVIMGIVTIGVAIGADFEGFEEPGVANAAKTAMSVIGPASLLLGLAVAFIGFRPTPGDHD